MSVDKHKTAWGVAIYGAACAFGIFGWVGLVCLLVLALAGFLIWLKAQEEPASPARSTPTQTCDVTAGQRCPLCHADFEVMEVVETCADCGTLYHRSCRQEWRVCSTLGCGKRARRVPGPSFVVATQAPPRVRANPKVRRKIKLELNPSSGAIETPSAKPATPEQLSRAAQRVLHRRVAS